MSRIFLAMNGKRINTLDDLRSNFNPDQMLSFYRSRRLQKWLEECGATEELENINGFEANYDDATLLSMLMAVFELNDNQISNAQALLKTKEETSTPAVPESISEKEPSHAENSSQQMDDNKPVNCDSAQTQNESYHEQVVSSSTETGLSELETLIARGNETNQKIAEKHRVVLNNFKQAVADNKMITLTIWGRGNNGDVALSLLSKELSAMANEILSLPREQQKHIDPAFYINVNFQKNYP